MNKQRCQYKLKKGVNKGRLCPVHPKTGKYCYKHKKSSSKKSNGKEKYTSWIVPKGKGNKTRCAKVITRGPTKGKQCKNKHVWGSSFCSKHKLKKG